MSSSRSSFTSNVQIVPFEPKYALAFADLNYEWIKRSYVVEERDHEQLDHPIETIISPGGQMLFCLVDSRPAGTVAMIEMGDSFELAKMAVSREFRGRKLGDRLMKACIDFARERNAQDIILNLIPASRRDNAL